MLNIDIREQLPSRSLGELRQEDALLGEYWPREGSMPIMGTRRRQATQEVEGE
jgi:hypothetical protein